MLLFDYRWFGPLFHTKQCLGLPSISPMSIALELVVSELPVFAPAWPANRQAQPLVAPGTRFLCTVASLAATISPSPSQTVGSETDQNEGSGVTGACKLQSIGLPEEYFPFAFGEIRDNQHRQTLLIACQASRIITVFVGPRLFIFGSRRGAGATHYL